MRDDGTGWGGGTRRHLLGFILTVPTAVLFWVLLTFLRLLVADGPGAALRDMPTLLVGGATVGVVAASGALLVLAGPVYALLMATHRVRRGVTLLAGAGVGLVTAVVWAALSGEGMLLSPWVGGLVGLATAAVWWRVARARGPTTGIDGVRAAGAGALRPPGSEELRREG